MGRAKLVSVLAGGEVRPPPRGEIWVAPAVLEIEGLPNSPIGVAALGSRLGADLCFVSSRGPQPVGRGIKGMRRAVAAAHARDLACGGVVDGPWQRLVSDRGLHTLLLGVARRDERLDTQLEQSAGAANEEIDAWAATGADLVLLADDVAFGGGPYFSPALFTVMLLPYYRQFAASAAAGQIALGFHSDGDLTLLLPALAEAGFSFFSLEPEATDPAGFQRQCRNRPAILSGIRADWLCPPTPGQDLSTEIAALSHVDRLILASSCGLTDGASLTALRAVYRIADRVLGVKAP